MNNRRSYLESINAGRKRRPTTSLEELSNTLEELESRIGRSSDEGRGNRRMRTPTRRAAEDGWDSDRRDAPRERMQRTTARDNLEDRNASRRPTAERGFTEEVNALRNDLHQQLSAGLRREFAHLKQEIEQAVRTSAPASQVAELGVELERLVAMIQKLAQRTDDRQTNMLRLEMEEVKTALSKLAREDTMQSFDRRWDEMDRRWSDLATQVSQAGRSNQNDAALKAFGTRLEEINQAVSALPNSVTLHGLEQEMKALATTVDRIAHRQDRIAPDTLASIEDRLDEISRAVAASGVSAAPAAFNHEPLERIEARISSLAHQLGEVVDDNPAIGLVDQLAMLSNRVEDIASKVDLPGEMIERLADQIDTIARKMDHASHSPQIDDVFRHLEDRFTSLSGLLEQRHEDALAQGHSLFRDLETRLEQVASRIGTGETATPASDAHLIEAIDLRFADLTSRLERQQPATGDDVAIRNLDARLDAISRRLESSVAAPGVDSDLIRSLESQIAGLTAHIAQPSSAAMDTGSTLLPRLDQIEHSISQTRQDLVEAARKAAEDAIRGFSGSKADDGLVIGLVDDLKSLEALTRKSDDRNAKTFEAIHDTLLKIVDRLGAVEAGVHDRGGVAQERETGRNMQLGLQETPALDSTPDTMWLQATPEENGKADKPSRKGSRTAAADAAIAAAADAAQDEMPAERGGRLSMLGGLSRALTSRRNRQEKSNPVEPTLAADLTADAPLQDKAKSVGHSLDIDMPIDPQVANRPLEPGSGAPDLNAIMKRVRDERGQPAQGTDVDAAKADFIAAARRAAQAAAAEAEVMKRAPQEKAKSGGLSRIFTNRKTVLMGVAAVLVALAAMQYGRMALGNRDVATAPQTAAVETVETVDEVASLPAVEDTQEQTVRETTTNSAASAMMALAPETIEDTSGDWLNMEAAAPLPIAIEEVAEEIAEAEITQDAGEELFVEIPTEAGPAALREAASSGDAKALFEIGNRYAEGRGVAENMAEAAQWYVMSAEMGLAPAQYRVGNMYEKGIGVERDVEQAKAWYERAAEQGNASAMHNLAVLYAMGADGATDNTTAARWFSQAAELGVQDSQFNLAILSARGVGVPQNLEAAYKWFSLVARAGDGDAAEKRDEVAKILQPEQLQKAQADTELWAAKPLDPEANSVEIPESWSEGTETTASIDMRQAMRNIQQILNQNGYDAGSVDGLMGQKTKAAIAAFQKDNGLAATGAVDEALVKALLDRS